MKYRSKIIQFNHVSDFSKNLNNWPECSRQNGEIISGLFSAMWALFTFNAVNVDDISVTFIACFDNILPNRSLILDKVI